MTYLFSLIKLVEHVSDAFLMHFCCKLFQSVTSFLYKSMALALCLLQDISDLIEKFLPSFRKLEETF
jgi:hypothetical protein